jgi:hypothetical protein
MKVSSWIKILLVLVIKCSLANATPSSVFWTVCTTDVYTAGTGHIDQDNYFTIFKKRGANPSFAPDIGFELGAFSWKDISVETGVDYTGGTNHPLFFNVGAGIAEDKIFCHSPSFKVGIFNVGTHYCGQNRTDQNIADIIIGKSLPDWIGGKLFLGGFSGSKTIGKNRQGFMVAFTRPFCPAKDCNDKEYFKWVLAADYASGKNTIGGGGVGMYYYFTPEISILTGPVWFNDQTLNGKWKWSVQVDISVALF